MRTTATPPPQAAAPLPPAARAYSRDNHARWSRMETRRWRCVAVQEVQSLRTVQPRIAATLASMPHDRPAERCATGRDVARWLATRRCAVGRRFLACGETMGGRCTLLECNACSALVARMRTGRATLRAASCENFSLVAAADRPPLRRVSDDVVTAGLISSWVWFGPVPGNP
ncbi:hypothetical protein F511_45784 [Dorcoceras hygrometricum]|uniref:Uncharacterized protein n=1 Tax=Dorcoceras hygrometricum TaxID=472368 RepID=A0A2Z6ZWA2_9LAMI|nr:hypothetical protein F511_45784 [Dorcoceras hygrometricum]